MKMKKHKFQRTRRGVVVPEDIYSNSMAEMYAIMRDISSIVGALKKDPSELNIYRMERAVLRTVKSLRKIRVEMGSCPSSVWKMATWRGGIPRMVHMGWLHSGVDGLVR